MNGQAHNGTSEGLLRGEVPKYIDIDSKSEFTVSLLEGSESVEAELKCVLDGTVVKCEVSVEGAGRFTIAVVPAVRGRHELSITSNGSLVEGAPVPILVSCPPQLLGRPVRVIEGVNRPGGVALLGDNEIVITEIEPPAVAIRDLGGKVLKSFDEGSPQLDSPYGVTVDSEGSIYVAELVDCRIFKFSREGHIIKTVCIGGDGKEQETFPACIKASQNDKIYVCDDTNKKVHVYNKNLEKLYSFGECGEAPGNLLSPSDIAFGVDGNVFVVDAKRKQIVKFTPEGKFLCEFETKCQSSELELGISVAPNGLLFVSDFWNSQISVFDQSGQFLNTFGRKGAEPGELDTPAGIAVDRDGFVYVCDQGNGRIQVF